jgi:hypothetical protein
MGRFVGTDQADGLDSCSGRRSLSAGRAFLNGKREHGKTDRGDWELGDNVSQLERT